MRFRDRSHAGQVLAYMLRGYADRTDLLALGLPRGGVPVAFEVAMALNAPLDVFVVRKLGVPGHEELAMGAIAGGGITVINWDVVRSLGIPQRVVELVMTREQEELTRRERAYRGDRPAPEIKDKTVIVVDDGLATGYTMRAAVQAVRSRNPLKIIVAVPVAPREACDELALEADEVMCTYTPEVFSAVSLWYESFSQTTDREVRELYEKAARRFETVVK